MCVCVCVKKTEPQCESFEGVHNASGQCSEVQGDGGHHGRFQGGGSGATVSIKVRLKQVDHVHTETHSQDRYLACVGTVRKTLRMGRNGDAIACGVLNV